MPSSRTPAATKGCSHEWWHKFNEKKKNEALRAHAHMKMREIAYFLHALDSDECREANGRTILENSLITISTESGDGRHNDVKRELSGVFHCITGANGRFKTGQIMDVGAEGLDVYNTMLNAFGTKIHLGPKKRKPQPIDKIRGLNFLGRGFASIPSLRTANPLVTGVAVNQWVLFTKRVREFVRDFSGSGRNPMGSVRTPKIVCLTESAALGWDDRRKPLFPAG